VKEITQMKPFDAHVNEYDEKGRASDIEVLLSDPEDVKKARQIMAATGVGSELEAVIMVFRRYQPDFLKWWSGDTTAAPMPLSSKPAPADQSSPQEESDFQFDEPLTGL
jgi:hypothetical protein